MKSTWVYRIEFHSEEQLVRRFQCCKEINQKMVFKKIFLDDYSGTSIGDWPNTFTTTRFHYTKVLFYTFYNNWGRKYSLLHWGLRKVENPNWLASSQLAWKKRATEALNWGLLRTNPAKSRGHGLNLWPLDYNFIALTAQPLCLTVRSEQNSVF